MRRAAVVPQQEIAHAPDVRVDEFGLLGMVEHGVEQRFALLRRHVDDADRHQPVHVDRLLAGVLLGAKYRMRALTEGRGAAAVTLLRRPVIVVVHGWAALEPAADGWTERLTGGGATVKQRVAACRRNF